MTALVSKNLKAGGITLKLMLIFVCIAALLGIVLRWGTLNGVVIGGLSGGFVGSYLLYFYSKTDAVWQKHEFNMPIKISHVELSRYISHVIAFVLSNISPVVFLLVSYFSGAANFSCDCSYYAYYACTHTFFAAVGDAGMPWVVVYFVLGAFLFPTLRAISIKYAYVIPQVIGFVIAMAILILSNFALDNHYQMQNARGNAIVISGAIALFAASYFVSLYLYRRKIRKKGILG